MYIGSQIILKIIDKFYLMIIISETKNPSNKPREKVSQPLGRSRISEIIGVANS